MVYPRVDPRALGHLRAVLEIAEREAAGTATIHDAIWLSWVKLFAEVGAQMACGGVP